MRTKASLELDATMTNEQVIKALEALIFTAAREWKRTVRIDKSMRDALVLGLKELRLDFPSDLKSSPTHGKIRE